MASSGSLAGLATLRRRHCFLPPKVKVRSPPTRHFDGQNKGRSRPPQIRNLLLGRRVEEFLPGRRAAFTTPTHSQRSCPGVGEVGWRKAPLPQKLGAFTEKYPAIRPILRIGDSAGIIDDLLDGKVELGFVGFKAEDARLVFEKIWDDEMILVVPKDHAWTLRKSVQLADLRTEKLISRERGSGTLDSLRRLLSKNKQSSNELLNISMELGSTEAIKEAIMAGYGMSILSRISIRYELAAGNLVEIPIRGLTMQREFYQVYHSRRPLHPIAQAFREFLKQG